MADGSETRLWADVVGLLARLHDREVDGALLNALRGAQLDDFLGGLLAASSDPGAGVAFCEAVDRLGEKPGKDILDVLAADYADIFLNHGYRVAPNASVWLTEDHLERQQPMFDVRAWYAHYGVEVPDWRLRADDHLVHELQFVEVLLEFGDEDSLVDAARFLDRHLLPWSQDFFARMEDRAQTAFHRSAARLSKVVLDLLRRWLEERTGIAPEVLSHAFAQEQDRQRRAAEVKEIARPFVPGVAESW